MEAEVVGVAGVTVPVEDGKAVPVDGEEALAEVGEAVRVKAHSKLILQRNCLV